MSPPARNYSVDIARGAVMVLMTIDHAREFGTGLGKGVVTDPMDLDAVTPALFLLRWITHFCAPVFALLMGASLSLRGRGQTVQSSDLVKRGVLLLLLELTIINWSWTFNPFWPRYFFQVIAALGVALLALALTVRWPAKVSLLAGVAIVAGHNLLDGVSFETGTWQYYLFSFLHQKNVLPVCCGFELRTTYPVLPVVGIALCGYGIGDWFHAERGTAKLFRLGAALTALFVLLRATNLYGDPSPFVFNAGDLSRTVMSFGNVTKYPLSLQFILMTLGPALLLLGSRRARSEKLELLGRVPLFYYVSHLITLHALALLFAWMSGHSWSSFAPSQNFGAIPRDWAMPLGATVLFALGTTILLLPACRWYARIRPAHPWLGYL